MAAPDERPAPLFHAQGRLWRQQFAGQLEPLAAILHHRRLCSGGRFAAEPLRPGEAPLVARDAPHRAVPRSLPRIRHRACDPTWSPSALVPNLPDQDLSDQEGCLRRQGAEPLDPLSLQSHRAPKYWRYNKPEQMGAGPGPARRRPTSCSLQPCQSKPRTGCNQ